MALVIARDVVKRYSTGSEVSEVLKGLDLDIEKGEMVMVMGPSGSGKTTLLNILGGIDRPDGGTITVGDRELSALSPALLNAYRRTDVGFIFQFYNLIPTLTAHENILLGLETSMEDRKEAAARAEKYLGLVGLGDKRGRLPQELSAGEQQRVAIARALAREPKLVLADEPTGNLDEDRGLVIMELMKRLQKELGMTFIIVSHNSGLRSFAERTLVLHHGKLEGATKAAGATAG
jgi:putative ABC transport system ATP-binding protein